MVRRPAGESNQPVFVDGSGRRRRLATFLGVAIGVGLALSLGLVVAGLFGVSPVQVPGLPDSANQPAQVQQPAPTPNVPQPSGSGLRPPTTPTALPAPTAGAVQPGTVTNTTHPRGGPSRTHPTPTRPA